MIVLELTEEEVDDVLGAIDGFMQYDYFVHGEEEKFEKLMKKIDEQRDKQMEEGKK